ncbi:MAG: hypothetical protein R3B55_00780 [Candidatus Paceibacterota bacterium]
MKNNDVSNRLILAMLMFAIAALSGIHNAQAQQSFEADPGARALVSKALKYYGSGQIQGDKVFFKGDRHVGFIVVNEDQKKAIELVTERALSEPGTIQNSQVKLFRNVNQVTQCPWYKGEIFSYSRKGKNYTLLVCKK